MPARSEERTNARKEEIINACEMLYQTMNFKDITIKEIGNVTSFSRTSIYNYFETKEEIFLALLKREYDAWILDLHKIVEEHESMDDEQIASAIAKSLDQRHQLLKILSMNHYDLEENRPAEISETSAPSFCACFTLEFMKTVHLVPRSIGCCAKTAAFAKSCTV